MIIKNNIRIAAVLAFLAIGFASCDKIKEAIFKAFATKEFEVSYTIPVITGPAGTVYSIPAASIYINLDSTIKAETNNEFDINTIDKIYAEQITLTLDNADDASNLSNFSNAAFYIAKTETDLAAASAIASADIPLTAFDTYDLNVDKSIDVKSYFVNNNTVYYKGKLTLREATAKELNAKAKIKFKVE